jgi:hypothetical protein
LHYFRKNKFTITAKSRSHVGQSRGGLAAQLFGLPDLIDVWARRNPPNVGYLYHAADYGARQPLSYLNFKLFVRLIRYFLKNKLIINVKTMLTISMETIGMNTKLFSFWMRISLGNQPNQLCRVRLRTNWCMECTLPNYRFFNHAVPENEPY